MISPLPKPQLLPKRMRLAERKAVTVALAAKCADGVIMCADTEVGNGEYKFYKSKIFRLPIPYWINGEVLLAYAGSPDLMDSIAEKLRSELVNGEKNVEAALQKSLNAAFQTSEEAHQVLCAFSDGALHLLKSLQRSISPVSGWDCVGFGGSALVRYLGGIFLNGCELPIQLGIPICNYIVSQAKKYVNYCGGDTNLVVLTTTGKVYEQVSSAKIDAACEQIESRINDVLTQATMLDINEGECLRLIRELRQLVQKSADIFYNFVPPMERAS